MMNKTRHTNRLGMVALLSVILGVAILSAGCDKTPETGKKPAERLTKKTVTTSQGDTAITPGLILHLAMDDNAATPTVQDASQGHHDQTFGDPGGKPNTDAHSVPGVIGTALAFDGVNDHINLGTGINDVFTAGHDFAISLFWRKGEGNNENYKFLYSTTGDNTLLFFLSGNTGDQPYITADISISVTPKDRFFLKYSNCGYGWNHYVLQRKNTRFELWVNGKLHAANDTPGNDRAFSGIGDFVLGGLGQLSTKGSMDDFRVYDRSLLGPEIEALSGLTRNPVGLNEIEACEDLIELYELKAAGTLDSQASVAFNEKHSALLAKAEIWHFTEKLDVLAVDLRMIKPGKGRVYFLLRPNTRLTFSYYINLLVFVDSADAKHLSPGADMDRLCERIPIWPQITSTAWIPGEEILITQDMQIGPVPYSLQIGFYANIPPHQLGQNQNVGWYVDIPK